MEGLLTVAKDSAGEGGDRQYEWGQGGQGGSYPGSFKSGERLVPFWCEGDEEETVFRQGLWSEGGPFHPRHGTDQTMGQVG